MRSRLGGGVANHILNQRPNGFSIIVEMLGDPDTGVTIVEVRMMDEIEAGNINCVITKDLSRFGREHIMMGYYLEFVFPKLKVRYSSG